MSHLRQRHLSAVFSKSLKFWPVLCLAGARQVGKSTFLKTLKKFKYISLDNPGTRALAQKNPRLLLTPPCSVDEAQKVPSLFDAVKWDIDTEKRPGKFILTGSVRFSVRTRIRESLTGRAKTLQMYPLTCAEAASVPFKNHWLNPLDIPQVSRKSFERHLNTGGMPAIFAARSIQEVRSYWQSLIESYVYRDLLLALSKNPNPNLALDILKIIAEILALGELPIFSRILKKTGGTRLQLEKHLKAMEDMMILHRIEHWETGKTKDLFLPFDPAFFLQLISVESASHDAAIHLACLHITLINEALSQYQSSGNEVELKYALSPSGELVHLITQDLRGRPVFWKIFEEPVPHAYDLRFLSALGKKYHGKTHGLTSIEKPFTSQGIGFLPWECVL